VVIAPQSIAKAVISPRIAELHIRRQPRELEDLLRTSATLAGSLSIAAFLAYALAGGSLLGKVYGDLFRSGWGALIFLAAGHTLGVCLGVAATTLLMIGEQMRVMAISVVCTVVTLAVGAVCAMRFGVTGLAAAIAAGTALQNVLMWTQAKSTAGVWTHLRVGWRNAE
jgi:O-antigen/teichoic acid export membrane protein